LPELPEVETVRQGLLQAVINKKIVDVNVRNPKLRFPIPTEQLEKLVIGGKIIDIRRRAKYLLFKLDNKSTIIAHLGMSGNFLFISSEQEFDKHDHVIFYLESQEQLRFRDPRRFGMIDAVLTSDLENHKRLKNLGVEPLSNFLTPQYCISKVGKSERPIKNCLFDGTFIVGLGNIYINEVLFMAGILPDRPAKSISKNEWEKLVSVIKEVLTKAVEQGGTTLQDEGFMNVLGDGGHFQVSLQIYGKAGEKCSICTGQIERIVQQNRSSFICKNCQH
jgi:formamidopyrimidine-DNA glycosylase